MTYRPLTDDDDDPASTLMGSGSAHAVSGADDDHDAPAGVVWIPDPEQRRGWRERYVYPAPKPGAERRPLGFRKP